MTISDRYIHHRNLLKRGQQEIALYIAVFNVAMLLSVFLRTILHLRATWIAFFVVGCIIGILVFCYFIGWTYNRGGYWQAEVRWVSRRNPDLQKIKNDVEEIKEILKT